jgi:hypothetical protein
MHNVKAFLEGLIVNEVLTKTASFEKLAFPPVYAIPQALQTANALRAAKDLWQRRRASQKPLAIDMEGKPPSKDGAIKIMKEWLQERLAK